MNPLADFLKLVQNENMKIYRRARTWIMLGIIILLPILISVLFYSLATGDERPSIWMLMDIEAPVLYMLAVIFTVVLAADSVAGEYTWGTIKLLLIRPWSRATILLSKYVSLLVFALLCSVLAFVVTLGINAVLFGYSNSVLEYGELIEKSSPLNDALVHYAYQFITLVFIVTFGFMLSTAFRSGGLAIGLALFLLLAGNTITSLIMAATSKPWIKYLPFMHLDLTSYLNGGTGPIYNHPMTLGFSLAILGAYFVLFNLISWFVFMKRDVTA